MLCRPVRILHMRYCSMVLFLFCRAHAVVCLQTHSRFPKAIVLKKVVEKTNYSVGSLSCVTSFINDEVYLPWDSFTANAKEVDWAGLQWVAGVMHLLCKVQRVMHIDRVGCRCNCPIWSRWNKHSLLAKVHVYSFSASLNLVPIE